MLVYRRRVRFEEVDAAAIVFFARYLNYAHEAMEELFGALEGGYEGVVVGRRVGFPAVHVDAEYAAPLRFGDTFEIALDVARIGETSCTLRYRFTRAPAAAEGTAVYVATVRHTVVCCTLEREGPRKRAFPAEVRALLEHHLAAPAA